MRLELIGVALVLGVLAGIHFYIGIRFHEWLAAFSAIVYLAMSAAVLRLARSTKR